MHNVSPFPWHWPCFLTTGDFITWGYSRHNMFAVRRFLCFSVSRVVNFFSKANSSFIFHRNHPKFSQKLRPRVLHLACAFYLYRDEVSVEVMPSGRSSVSVRASVRASVCPLTFSLKAYSSYSFGPISFKLCTHLLLLTLYRICIQNRDLATMCDFIANFRFLEKSLLLL